MLAYYISLYLSKKLELNCTTYRSQYVCILPVEYARNIYSTYHVSMRFQVTVQPIIKLHS